MAKKKPCTTCGDKKSSSKIIMPCKVCELLDDDHKPKQVIWCNWCQAYICNADNLNLIRRTKAFLKS